MTAVVSLFMVALIILSPVQATAEPRIAIASAFAEELAPLLEQTTITETVEIGGVVFSTGTLAGHEVVLFSTDVSMVNAAMNTQRAIDHFPITALFYTGIAGGLSPDAQIGEVIVPAGWGQYGEAVYARIDEGGVFQPPSWLDSPFAAFGMMFPKAVTVRGEAHFWFRADTTLMQNVESDANVIVGGNGVSGQAFIDNRDFADYLYETFDAQVVDMESAAVAQVAYANRLPFLIVRGISDLPGRTSEAEMRAGYRRAIENAARVVIAAMP
jgi:adenosylhomocysteine nucleosidase